MICSVNGLHRKVFALLFCKDRNSVSRQWQWVLLLGCLLVTIYISPCVKTRIVNNLKTTGENDSKHLKIFCNQYQNRLHRVSTSRAYKLSTLLTLESIFLKSSLEKKFLVTFRYCWTGNWVLMSSSKRTFRRACFISCYVIGKLCLE